MRAKKLSAETILRVLKKLQTTMRVKQICREENISRTTAHRIKKQFPLFFWFIPKYKRFRRKD